MSKDGKKTQPEGRNQSAPPVTGQQLLEDIQVRLAARRKIQVIFAGCDPQADRRTLDYYQAFQRRYFL